MTLSPGARLGPYEIVAAIGAGGMGEVYKARDTRLNRTVALKVLLAQGRGDPGLRERFTREAQAISALDHPHICVLHDVGGHDGGDFLVMEYLEGETLAQRLERGPLPLDQVLRYGIQIADALNSAHRRHIVHRDLKPGNVMLTKSGPKLLDFGLAKVRRGSADVGGSALTGLDGSLTGQGTILGTLQYMAPEQLEGKDVDARADIFAFGAVLYEMATGKRAFDARSQASLIATILEHDPPSMSAAQPTTPPLLDHIVHRCLAKDPDGRWQSAADLMWELQWVGDVAGHSSQPLPSATPRQRRWTFARWAALLLAAGLGAGVSYLLAPDAAAPPLVARVAIPLTPAESLMLLRVDRSGAPVRNAASLTRAPAIAIAGDGRRLVYAGYAGGQSRLYVRRLDQVDAEPLAGTEGAEGPFFSPDGQWVGFFAQDQLKKIAVSGGAPVTLAPVQSHRGGTWGSNGTIVFARGSQGGLSSVSADGGAVQPLTTLDQAQEQTHRYPELLPGAKAVIFSVGGGDLTTFDDARIDVLSLETGERKVLMNGAGYARYVPTGHLLYARAGALYAVPFDVARLRLTGQPALVLPRLTTWPSTGHAEFAVSSNGSLIYAPGEARQRLASLAWVSQDGRVEAISPERRVFAEPRVSPDGQRIVTTLDTGVPQVWVLELGRGTLTRLAFPGTTWNPVWTSGGTQVAFAGRQAGLQSIFQQPADGSAPARRVVEGERGPVPRSWSDARAVLAYEDGGDIWTLPAGDAAVPRRFLETPYNERHAVFSPDGGWLAYVSEESGRQEIYVRPYPGPALRYQISTSGGSDPAWSKDGRQLFYREAPGRWMKVDIRTGPSWQAGKPTLLFEGPYDDQYDVAPDGRFVVVRGEPLPPVTQLHMIQNWFEELRLTMGGAHARGRSPD